MGRRIYIAECPDCEHEADDHSDSYGCPHCDCDLTRADMYRDAYRARYARLNAERRHRKEFDSDDFDDEEGTTTRSGGCFIATAAYGSPLDPRLDSLRAWRDSVLMPFAIGRALVAAYYATSPPIARLVAGSNMLRRMVRACLRPVLDRIEGR